MDKSSGRRTLAVADAKLIAIAIAKPLINTTPTATLYPPALPHPFRAT